MCDIQQRQSFESSHKLHLSNPDTRFVSNFSLQTLVFLRKKIAVTEHWTAYYRNFGLPKDHKGLERIKEIFFKPFHLITVSEALKNDITNFSKNRGLKRGVFTPLTFSKMGDKKGGIMLDSGIGHG